MNRKKSERVTEDMVLGLIDVSSPLAIIKTKDMAIKLNCSVVTINRRIHSLKAKGKIIKGKKWEIV